MNRSFMFLSLRVDRGVLEEITLIAHEYHLTRGDFLRKEFEKILKREHKKNLKLLKQ